MKLQKSLFFTSLLLLIICAKTTASDYKLVSRLSGYWKFSIGDDQSWSQPKFNDASWDQIYVPADWERNGYDDYNGYAWYRKSFQVYNLPDETPAILKLGRIDDVNEVYLNGVLIGKTGEYPPNYKTAYEISSEYIIPKNLLNFDKPNILAIRVYDGWGLGGMRTGEVGIYIDADYSLIDIPLNGNWKFKLGNRREWNEPDFNDNGWETLIVPMYWDQQGYADYDGYACYRKKFVISDRYRNESKYLCLGRIDDVDEVYLNGEFIGTVYDLKGKLDYGSNGNVHRVKRVYYLPEGLIKYGQQNVITVVVYDGKSRGGIYEGPIGIMSGQNYERYRNKHDTPSTFWEYLYEWLVE